MSRKLRTVILRLAGALLLALGVLHLGVTPIIARMLKRGMSAESAQWLSPPMLLNHVVVGILLLPLGALTLYAAVPAGSGTPWALVVVRVTALAVATLPLALGLLMGAHYFEAVAFVIATVIVCAASVALLVAAFWPVENAGT